MPDRAIQFSNVFAHFSFLFSRLCFISLLRMVAVVVGLVQAQFKVLKLGIWTLNVISLTSYKKKWRP